MSREGGANRARAVASYLLDRAVRHRDFLVHGIHDIARRLRARQIAHVHATAHLRVRVVLFGHFALDRHDAVPARRLVVELSRRDRLAPVGDKERLAELIPIFQHLRGDTSGAIGSHGVVVHAPRATKESARAAERTAAEHHSMSMKPSLSLRIPSL